MRAAVEPVLVPTPLGDVAVHAFGAGLPTVLWHALFTDASSWGYLLPQLLPGRRLLVVDGPGWGRSARVHGRVRFPDGVDAAVAVLDAFAPRTAVDWVGNGWGGHVGLELAVEHPARIRSIITLAAPVARSSAADRRRLRRVLAGLRITGPVGPVGRVLVADLLGAESRTEPQTVGAVLDALMLAGRLGAAKSAAAFELRRPDQTSLLPHLTVPALLVTAEEHPAWAVADAERAAALAPFAWAASIPRSGALIPLDQPAALATVIRDFWSTLGQPA